ncbi:hypothetical protein SeLEV6574_g02285 [Synchytrium endobioticum]|uniref:Uncharacterized protein n=1 Tax=Synchytrium endobioticum TaxID=286115 RepID=A0A507DAW9_9FUNG|nr:hypothetical protein SeLEV6574_g02285 [Synchytrium endobioticum]
MENDAGLPRRQPWPSWISKYRQFRRPSVEENTVDLHHLRRSAVEYYNSRNRVLIGGVGAFGVGFICVMIYLLFLVVSKWTLKGNGILIHITNASFVQLTGAVLCGTVACLVCKNVKNRCSKFEEDATKYAEEFVSHHRPPSTVAGDIEMGRLSHPVTPTRDSPRFHMSDHGQYEPGSHYTSTSIGSSTNSNGAGLDSLQQ